MKYHELGPGEKTRITQFYELTSYKHPVSPDDRVFVAKDDIIYGAVRIESRNSVQVLRGMYMHPEHVQKGIGSQLLSHIEGVLSETESYCIPLTHLLAFYGKAGFKEIVHTMAPEFLAERIGGYLAEGKDVVIMHRPTGSGD